MLDEGMSDSRSPVKKPIMEDDDDDDDDDLMPATGRPRNRGSFLDDDDNSQGMIISTKQAVQAVTSSQGYY